MILDSGPKKNPTDVAIYFTFFSLGNTYNS